MFVRFIVKLYSCLPLFLFCLFILDSTRLVLSKTNTQKQAECVENQDGLIHKITL